MNIGFDRVPVQYRYIVEEARSYLPKTVTNLINPKILFGSPSYVGLHDYKNELEEWAHACFKFYYGEQFIVIPKIEIYEDPIAMIIHEYGHLYDEATNFELDCPETTEYSESNPYERFAEGFVQVLYPETKQFEEQVQSESFRPLQEILNG